MTVVAHDEAQSLKARIFSAAIAVFAEHGLSGARMEQIATEAQTTKRMVVYYFKSKEQLYQEVLQHVYARIRETEQQLGLENVPPVEALVRLVRWSVRYHATHADYMLSLIHISEPTRLGMNSYAVFCLKKKDLTRHDVLRTRPSTTSSVITADPGLPLIHLSDTTRPTPSSSANSC